MWVSEFEVNSDFNLHIERTKGGIISLYQRTTGGGWDHVDAFEYVRHQASIDFDCSALVYPKWCKIESEVEPSYAAITTDGEVTEIKSQSKEVEITANGVTEIAPDAGFGYLSGVKVNVNVPTGGGDAPSGGEGGDRSEMRYYSKPELENLNMQIGLYISMCTHIYRYRCGDIVYIGPYLFIETLKQHAPDGVIDAIGIDMSSEIKVKAAEQDVQITTKEYLDMAFAQMGANITVDDIPSITKEEFYAL